MIAVVTLFSNGMVMVFDEKGEQVGEHQGRACDVLRRILAEAPVEAKFYIGSYWINNHVAALPCHRAALEAFAEQFEVRHRATLSEEG